MNLASRFLLVSALVSAASMIGCARGQTLTPNGEGGDGAAGGSGTSNNGGAGGAGATGGTTSDTTSSMSTSHTTTSTTTTTTNTFTNTTTSTFTMSTGTGTLGSACDGTGNCQTCGDCAQADTCVLESTICGIDPECSVDFYGCIQPCADDACIQACVDAYPIGAQEYIDLLSCVICVACTSDCDAAANCM